MLRRRAPPLLASAALWARHAARLTKSSRLQLSQKAGQVHCKSETCTLFLTGANTLLKLRSSGPKHRGLPVSHSYTCTYPVAHSARSFSMLQSHATIGQLKASLFLRTVLSAGFSICRQPMVLPDSLPAINPSNIHSSRGSCYGQQKS